jgi:hypothetical protein
LSTEGVYSRDIRRVNSRGGGYASQARARRARARATQRARGGLTQRARQDERYSVTVPRREWEEAPSGWLARGNFTMQTTFTDDDGVKHLDLELPWELKTGWE